MYTYMSIKTALHPIIEQLFASLIPKISNQSSFEQSRKTHQILLPAYAQVVNHPTYATLVVWVIYITDNGTLKYMQVVAVLMMKMTGAANSYKQTVLTSVYNQMCRTYT